MMPRRPLLLNDPRHGTAHAYAYHSCRCNKCKEAKAQQSREYQQERLARITPEEHGTPKGYRMGCRCQKCKEHNAATAKAWKAWQKSAPSQVKRMKHLNLGDLA